MTFSRGVADDWFRVLFRGSLIVAAAWTTLLVAGCSVDTRGFGGDDAGTTGSGGSGGMTSGSGGTSSGSGGLTGSGGVPATGGMPGSGGAHASGGAPGSGGHVGSGGAAAGGHVASGGAAAGGHVGSGGVGGDAGGAGHEASGTGGKAAGGRSGRGGRGGGDTAGAGGEGGETCAQLVQDYTKAMTEARTCTAGAAAQCEQSAPATLTFCTGCPLVIVNDDTRLTAIHSQWTAAGCAVATVCPAIACMMPPPGMCKPTDSGFCQASGVAAN